jgi:hypothetical protein
MPAGVEKQVCKYVKHLMDQDGKMRKGVVINFNQETEEIETSEHTPEITTHTPDQLPKRRKVTPMDDADTV